MWNQLLGANLRHAFHTVALLAVTAVLSACGGAPDRGSDRGADPAPAVSVLPIRFSDADPHPEVRLATSNHPVHGIDVSRFQGPIDWFQVAQSGVSFAFIKATEGGDLVDPLLRDHMQGARRAGVPRGAYHFFYHCRPAAEQAQFFIDNVPREPGALPPVLDIEWTPTSPTCTIRREASVIRAEMAEFIRIVGAHYGQRPVIYTTLDFYHDNDLNLLGRQDFWLRSVAAHPRDAYPGQPWTFWQYTSTGLVPGITGKADINAFVGGADLWAAWLESRRQ